MSIRELLLFLQICRKFEKIYNMDVATRLFKSILRNNHQSLTKQRLEIFQVLSVHDSLDMASILSNIPNIDRSSAYRTLALFERLGIVDRLHFGFKHRFELSDKFRQHHHHLHCQKCGRIIPIERNENLENSITLIAKLANFHPTNHVIEINGLCENCTL